MRIFLILTVLGAVCYFGYRSFSNVIHGEPGGKSTTPAVVVPAAAPAPPHVEQPTTVVVPPVVGSTAIQASCHRFYVFVNRDVPQPPFARSETVGGKLDERGLQMSVDAGANAWVMRGSIIEVEQMLSIAKGLDLPQDEVDLDFVLVALSEDFVRGWGVSALFNDGASYLTAFDLTSSGLNFTLAHSGASVSFTARDTTGSARIVSCPVVRAVTGEKWEFSADTQVPVPSLQRSEGVLTTAYEYHKVGLGLMGTLSKAPGARYRMHVEQRNGTVEVSPAKDSVQPPQLKEQTLKTSLQLEVGRWSCVGGVRSWSSETEKGIFSKSVKESQELLLVFCRPRIQLTPVPRALVVDAQPDSVLPHLLPYGPEPLSESGSPLLPPKEWKRRQWPDGIEPKGLPVPVLQGPRGK